MSSSRVPLAWVESPLQLLGAAEYAAAVGGAHVAFRLSGPQMPTTADELRSRGAAFRSLAPYVGIPWSLLAEHRDWVIGDPFSGQFRAAMSVLRPRSVTFVDDGAHTVHAARALLGETDYARPGQREGALKGLLGSLARDRVLRLAGTGQVRLFTAFADADPVTALGRLEIEVMRNGFVWLRDNPRPVVVTHRRVVLGSAHPVDGLMPLGDYLRFLRRIAAPEGLTYLPHRRETEAQLAHVAGLPSVTVMRTGMPVELALAGTTQPLDIVSLGSSAVTTLRTVLAGGVSSIRSVSAEARPVSTPTTAAAATTAVRP